MINIQEPMLDSPLPIDEDLLHGQLDNGLSYYIRDNKRPRNRLEIRLVVRAGSILEDDDQLGLAHIVEHMAFNGTKRFKPREIVSYFESIGAQFGAHLNAYTSFDETVYKLHIPMDDLEVLDRSFTLLRDWAADLTFNPDEIERERKVGLEEWRQGRNATARLRDQILPKLYYNSKYIDRKPIGTEQSLQTFDHQALKRFYTTWYRPELMGVIVVGDCDSKHIESLIIKHFSDLQSDPLLPEREYETIPLHDHTLYDVFYDEEISQSSISILAKRVSPKGNTHRDYRSDLVQSIAFNGINERLLLMTQQPKAPFIMARARIQQLNINTTADALSAVMPETQFHECTHALLKELARARAFGLSQSEFNRAKKGILTDIQAVYDEKNTTQSSKLTRELIRVFTTNESVPGIEYELQIVSRYLEDISLEEVNLYLSKWMSSPSKVVNIVTGESNHPNVDSIKTWFETTDFDDLVPPPTDEDLPPLLDMMPTKGLIESTYRLEDIDVDILNLSNGAKVWLKKTDFESDKILFKQFQKGGLSLCEDEDIVAGKTSAQLMFQSGVGRHDLPQLYRILSGVKAVSSPVIHRSHHGFTGFANNENLQNLLQLNYLQNHHPRFDQFTLLRQQEIHREQIKNKHVDPQTIFMETIQNLWWNHHPRYSPWRLEDVDRFDLKKSETFYRFLMKPSINRHYLFVGNLDKKTLLPFIETYLDIPSDGITHSIIKQEDPRIREAIKQTIHIGSEPVAHYELSTIVRMESSVHDRLRMRVLKELLSLRLRRLFREERGDVYSISVNHQLSSLPAKAAIYTFHFSCDPQKLTELTELLNKEINAFIQIGSSPEDLEQIKQQLLRSHENGLRENRSWINTLQKSIKRSEDPTLIIDYPKLIKDLSVETLQQYYNQYLNLNHRLEVQLLPKV